MHSSIRSRLIALVRAQWAGLLALFLVIAGGTGYAANTIGSADIINGQVKSADIGDNQVQSIDVRNGSLTGADIEEDTVGKVPDADTVDGVSSEDLKVGCPSGWKAVAGLCFEDPDVGTYTLAQAADRCGQLGGRIPTYAELVALAKSGVALASVLDADWTSSSVGDDKTIYIGSTTDTNNMDSVRTNGTSSFVRCVTTPVNTLGFP